MLDDLFTVGALFRTRPSYDLECARARPATFARALRANSFVILREAVELARLRSFFRDVITPAIERFKKEPISDEEIARIRSWPDRPVATMSDVMYRDMANSGQLTDELIQLATDRRHSLYHLIGKELRPLINAVSHGTPWSPSVVAHIRTIDPDGTGYTSIHYDYFVHRESRYGLNVWCPFRCVGEKVGTPTLQMIRAPLRDVVNWLCENDIRSPFAPGFFDQVRARFSNCVTLEMKLGDVVVFSNWTIHRTHVPAGAIHRRTSAEIRLVGPETGFDWLRN